MIGHKAMGYGLVLTHTGAGMAEGVWLGLRQKDVPGSCFSGPCAKLLNCDWGPATPKV